MIISNIHICYCGMAYHHHAECQEQRWKCEEHEPLKHEKAAIENRAAIKRFELITKVTLSLNSSVLHIIRLLNRTPIKIIKTV